MKYGTGEVYPGRGPVYFASLWLCGACLGTFALQYYLGITELLLLIQDQAFLQPWRYITSLFAHGSAGHLLSNLFALGLFGSILEGRIGSKRLLILFFTSGILINVFSPYERSLGASGAIFGILGALVVLRPWLVVWVNGIPMPMVVAGAIWFVQDTIGVFIPDGVGNLAHIGGLFLGMGWGVLLRKQFADRPTRKRKEDPVRKEIDRQVDKHIQDWEKEYLRR